jgi:hypothetical protein
MTWTSSAFLGMVSLLSFGNGIHLVPGTHLRSVCNVVLFLLNFSTLFFSVFVVGCCSCHVHSICKPAIIVVVLAINDKHILPVNMPTLCRSRAKNRTMEKLRKHQIMNQQYKHAFSMYFDLRTIYKSIQQ